MGIEKQCSSTLANKMDAAEKRVRQWLDDLFPEEDFGFVDDQFRDATAVRIVASIREIDAQRVN